ncbi:MAG TPA: hypothetical protein VKU89_07980 [Solirubrobacteraceae bacterium]|nr:hypothetical protein [Solirubrobacteraceae bacterium]
MQAAERPLRFPCRRRPFTAATPPRTSIEGVMDSESDAQQLLSAVWSPAGGEAPVPLPVDPFVIGRRLGIKAYAATLEEGISGILVKRAGQDPEIYAHAPDSPNRRRLTCAHELGHHYKRSAAGAAEWE